MNDIRHYLNIITESVHWEHIDVDFRGKRWPVEVKCFNGEADDWSFHGLSAADHEALHITSDEQEEVSEQIADALHSW